MDTHRIQLADDLWDGLVQVGDAGLFLPHEGLSDVADFLDVEAMSLDGRPRDRPDRRALAVWLAFAEGHPLPIGMALVSEEHDRIGRHHRINVFVHPQHRDQGVGRHLIGHAQSQFPDLRGHFNPLSFRLYRSMGVTDLVPVDHALQAQQQTERQARWESERRARQRFRR